MAVAKKRSKKTPFAVGADGRRYVEASAIMSPMIPFIDGIGVTWFGKSKRMYIFLEDAIAWVVKEMEHHSREEYEVILAVLRKFEAQPVSGGTSP